MLKVLRECKEIWSKYLAKKAYKILKRRKNKDASKILGMVTAKDSPEKETAKY